MTSTRAERDFGQVWVAFVQAIRELLAMLRDVPERRHLDPYERWTGAVLEAVLRERLIVEMRQRWLTLREREEGAETAELLYGEFQIFPEVVGGIRERFRRRGGRRSAPLIREGMSIGKTALDSLLELFDDLPLLIKGPLEIFAELMDIMKGPSAE